MILVAVGHIDADDALVEPPYPLCKCINLIVGEEGVDKDGFVLAGDQRAAHRRPHRLVPWRLGRRSSEWAHRSYKDVNTKRIRCHAGASMTTVYRPSPQAQPLPPQPDQPRCSRVRQRPIRPPVTR